MGRKNVANPANALREMSIPPTEEASFNTWIELEDAIAFLKVNARDDQFILYACLPSVFYTYTACPDRARNAAKY